MDAATLDTLIRRGETLEAEFKSDRRLLNDQKIYEEIVALANTNGGVLLIGVEDDGRVTGTQPRHGTTTDPLRIQSAIFNNTAPSINTRVSVVAHTGGNVIAVEVDRYPEICATMRGQALHRVIGPDGKPATVPFYPRDHLTRRVALGQLDYSATLLENLSFDDLDPLEFERLRQTITTLRGDRTLESLSDQELAKALRLVESKGGRLIPNVAGLLLLGREEQIRAALPTHEVHFQHLDALGEVKANDAFHGPLLKVLTDIESRFSARNQEREVIVGLFRVPIPDYSLEGFREALNNAVLHRDYTRLDAVYVQWHPDHLLITSPGGFPDGISIDNLLVHEPKPRNPRLAEAFKRIGIVEQTGRGVDKIYREQLRYGRPAPDYTRSDTSGVRVLLRGGEASLDFAALVFEQDRNGRSLTLDELLVLNELYYDRRIDTETVGALIQKGTAEGRRVLERLHERGLVEARGEKRGRTYHFSPALYKRFHMEAEYIRTRGFAPIQQEQMVLEYVKHKGRITRSDAAELCQISLHQASRLLRALKERHPAFRSYGTGRGTYYIWEA